MSPLVVLALIHLLALASPGPDFLFVTQTAISRSRGQALAGVAGIAAGIGVWAAAALLGLDLLFRRVDGLQRAVALAGGAYLLWLGLRLLRAAWHRRPPAGDAAPPATGGGGLFQRGLLTNLSNAKAVVYFASVFSGFAASFAGAARWGLWLLVVTESLAWFTLVALVFGLPGLRRGYLRVGRWLDAGAGLAFLAFGAHLAGTALL